MEFRVLQKNEWLPDNGKNTVYLRIDHWNDYSFVTMFHISFYDKDGKMHDLGGIRIGFKGQTTKTPTYSKLPNKFKMLGDIYFSLGTNVEYYRNLSGLYENQRRTILTGLRDIVYHSEIIEEIKEENVFGKSLLRDVSLSIVKGQWARVLDGQVELTDYKFKFARPETENYGGIELEFNVTVGTKPSTNIHSVIGRNGVGKTTLLNFMIEAITDRQNANSKFYDIDSWIESEISNDYFSSLVSVSFSAFDQFSPPQEQPDPSKGTCYFYIGLKDQHRKEYHRSIMDLQNDCISALNRCFSDQKKTERWFKAIDKLGSDEIFASMGLGQLEANHRELRINNYDEQTCFDSFKEKYQHAVTHILSSMSSGHAIVFLIMTSLVATVEEKTLVLLDEPESHLHPPLLSAFVRTLADLLNEQNGVAIIATHSPVVLQEIPRCCVWKIFRVGSNVTTSRPSIETFGENVGILTSEVFALEVERSGFHDLFTKSVATGKTYEEILTEYNNQLGFEGRAILRALIANRDRSSSHDALE